MVKVLFALAKYLTWWFIKPLVSRCCVANLTRMLQTSSFNQTHDSSRFKQYFPFLLGGENIHNFFIKSIASSHYLLNPLSVLVALKILRDILSFTRSFMINTRPLVGCLENSDRKVKQFCVIPRIALSRLVYCSSMHWPNWMCLVLQRDSRFVSRNCHATNIGLTERFGSNGYHLQW